MRNSRGVEIVKGHHVWLRSSRGDAEGKVMRVTGRGADAYLTLEDGRTFELDDVMQTLGPMTVSKSGTVRQNPDDIHIDIGSHNTSGRGNRAKNPRPNRAKNPTPHAAILAILLNAGNDRAGNPRRGWIVVRISGSDVEELAFVDHGYSGEGALKEYARESGKSWPIAQVGEFEISLAMYKSLKKSGVSYG